MLWGPSKIGKIGNVFACGERTSGSIAKRTLPLDSAHQIGLSQDVKRKANGGWGMYYEGGENPKRLLTRAYFTSASR